jgi:hypothetical protein
VKKIIAGVVGALVVVGAGVGLWLVLDSAISVATVGKVKVTESQLKSSVNQILAERKTVSTTGMTLASGANLIAEQLNNHVISILLADTVAANKVTVTDAQVSERVATYLKQAGSVAKLKSEQVSGDIASSDFKGLVLRFLYVEGLTKLVEKQGSTVANSGSAVIDLVHAQALKEGVTINPKYGTWNAVQVTVDAPTAATTAK